MGEYRGRACVQGRERGGESEQAKRKKIDINKRKKERKVCAYLDIGAPIEPSSTGSPLNNDALACSAIAQNQLFRL